MQLHSHIRISYIRISLRERILSLVIFLSRIRATLLGTKLSHLPVRDKLRQKNRLPFPVHFRIPPCASLISLSVSLGIPIRPDLRPYPTNQSQVQQWPTQQQQQLSPKPWPPPSTRPIIRSCRASSTRCSRLATGSLAPSLSWRKDRSLLWNRPRCPALRSAPQLSPPPSRHSSNGGHRLSTASRSIAGLTPGRPAPIYRTHKSPFPLFFSPF